MKLLIFNQYFPPDRAATGQLLGQLVQDLAVTNEITVVCGQPTYAPDATTQETAHSLRIFRTPLLRFSRSRLIIRLCNYLLFICGALVRALTLPRHDIVICWTDPPVIGLLGALTKFLYGTPFIFVSQDVYPEVAHAVGKMNDPISQLILRFTSRIILSWADAVVAVGHDMKKRLLAKGCRADKVHVIPNWQDLSALNSQAEGTFLERNGLSKDAFIVMHSGNIGFSQDFDALLGAAELLKTEVSIRFLIIGDGGLQNFVASEIARRNLSNVRMLPYQPTDQLSESLSAANLHYVSLKPSLTGYIVPSKVYGIMAVARPIITNVSEECDVDRIVKEAQCGIISTADPKQLATDILNASKKQESLRQMGQSGRKWIEQNGGRATAVSAYCELLLKVAPQ